MEKTMKITKKDYFATMRDFFNGALSIDDVDPDGLAEFCDKEIAALDKKYASAKASAAKRKAKADELLDLVKDVLTDEPMTIADVAAALDNEDYTVSKVGYRLRKLAEDGVAEKTEVTVAASEGQKARKLVAYKLV